MWKAAHTAYKKAAKLVPTSAHVHNRLGHLLAAQGDWEGGSQRVAEDDRTPT